ncbi:hypothetical protein NMG60_11002771 [Bertholletia excelsa]
MAFVDSSPPPPPSQPQPQPSAARRCLCSPTTHPGSFRCSLHRISRKQFSRSAAYLSRLDSISKVSVLRVFLMQVIKPSRRDIRRRENFQPKPTRFAVLNTSANGVAVSGSKF